MSVVIPPGQAPNDPVITANYLWSVIDKRIQDSIRAAVGVLGRPRSRVLTINFPVAGTGGAPVPGWIATAGIAHNIKVIGWTLNAITAGSITLDVQVSDVPSSSGTPPSFRSLPGPSHFISHSGYTSFDTDVANWNFTQIDAGSFIHIYVVSATGIGAATLALRVIDMDSRTFSP
jgi:hypothetical protein